MVEYNEGDIILCTVINVDRATVFVETMDKTPGSILFSEVAPGRIRNIREYVVPKKVIACKILSIKDNHLFLSLRRVKNNEREELMNGYKRERSFKSIIKKIAGDKSNKIIEEIKQKQSLTDFLNQAKEDSKILTKYFNKEEIEKILKVIQTKKEKEKEIIQEFKISSNKPNGIKIIKEILGQYKNIYYLGSSRFQIKETTKDLKLTGKKINNEISEIEKNAKKKKCSFELIKK
jgi:translation initiation factor 2 alpha subunit (eIF-2alpha)